MTEGNNRGNVLGTLSSEVDSWRQSSATLKAAEVLAALNDPVARAQEEASMLESDGRFLEALEYYEAIVEAFAAAAEMADEDERANLKPITEFWTLVAETKRDSLVSPVAPSSPTRGISRGRADLGAARRDEYRARRSSRGLAPEPSPAKPTKKSFDRRAHPKGDDTDGTD